MNYLSFVNKSRTSYVSVLFFTEKKNSVDKKHMLCQVMLQQQNKSVLQSKLPQIKNFQDVIMHLKCIL